MPAKSTAAGELGVNEKALQRAAKVVGLSAAAKQAAPETGLDHNRRALLAAAEESTPNKQVARIYRLADHKRDARRPAQHGNASSPSPIKSSAGPADDAADVIVAAWRRATPEARRRVVREIGDELQEIYGDLAASENGGAQRARRRNPSSARAGVSGLKAVSVKRRAGLLSRQYERDLRDAHLAGRDVTLRLQDTN